MREPVVMTLGTGRVAWVYDTVMILLALLVVALLPLEDQGWVRATNLIVWAAFVGDYGVRLALSTNRRAFLRRNIIELLAILPADLFRALRVLRAVRLIRLLRAATVLARVSRHVRGVATTNGLAWVLVFSLVTVMVAAVAATIIEPTIDSLPDALWWSIVTATTVGYGDLSPEHPIARGMAVVLMLVGIGTIGMLTGSIATYFITEEKAQDPDVEHIRDRLGVWEQLDAHERRRLVTMLDAIARQPETDAEE